jgi:hypothetical protein
MVMNQETYKKLEDGNHICAIYKDREQLFAQAIPYILAGLEAHKKCVYVYDENVPETIIQELKKSNPHIDTYLNLHQLELIPSGTTYLNNGHFDSEVMTTMIEKIIAEALKSGYVGVQGLSEMTWISGHPTDMNKLIEYESKLNMQFDTLKINLMCQYHEGRFSQEILANIIRTHKYVALYGNLYENKYFYTPPEYFAQDKPLPAHSYETIIKTIMEE